MASGAPNDMLRLAGAECLRLNSLSRANSNLAGSTAPMQQTRRSGVPSDRVAILAGESQPFIDKRRGRRGDCNEFPETPDAT
jgi:hypothetical protein